MPLVMAILNVTPDSFSDGGEFLLVEDALRLAEKLIGEGADILDIGGESTRPGSVRITAEEESTRVIPVIEAIAKRFDTPISIDTTKSVVAERAINSGAEIVNDISGLRWDVEIARVATDYNAGLIMMYSRGSFETMHSEPPVKNILDEVAVDFRRAVETAKTYGVRDEQIVLDIGIGFSKTLDQNLELLAKLDKLSSEFAEYPILVGTSRKSFIGKLLGGIPTDERLAGSLASISIAVFNGAKIVRVHDVKETVHTISIVAAMAAEKDL